MFVGLGTGVGVQCLIGWSCVGAAWFRIRLFFFVAGLLPGFTGVWMGIELRVWAWSLALNPRP